MTRQELPPRCRAGKWHPGWRLHRTVAWAIARLHLVELVKALMRSHREGSASSAIMPNGTRLKSSHELIPSVCNEEASNPQSGKLLLAVDAEEDRVVQTPLGCATSLQPPYRYERKGLTQYVHETKVLWSGDLARRVGSWPGFTEPPPAFAWVETTHPSDVKAINRSKACGNDYGDLKVGLIGTKLSGWLTFAPPINSSRCEPLMLCQAPIISATALAGSFGTQISLSDPGVLWELNGRRAVATPVRDQRDRTFATYGSVSKLGTSQSTAVCVTVRMLSVEDGTAPTTAIASGIPGSCSIRLRVDLPGVFAQITHLLWW